MKVNVHLQVKKGVFLFGSLLPLACLSATYQVSINQSAGTATVRVLLDSAEKLDFRMPAWAPGDYRIVNFGKRLSNISFFQGDKPVAPMPTDDPNRFIPAEAVDGIEYTVRQARGIFAEDLRIRQGEVVWNGPAVFGYFDGHQNEQHKLFLKKISEISKVEVALDPISADSGWVGFQAQNYDDLVDAPLVMGDSLEIRVFTLFGKEHRLVAFGRNQGVELSQIEKVMRPVVESAERLFGGLPYKNYRFLIDFDGGSSGLEHANSAYIAISRRITANDAAPLLAHEYFHAWNVKRIRSKPLNPFDYTKPAITGALWWLEGVTDYYADLLCYRAGLITRLELIDGFSSLLRGQTNPARFMVSAEESSKRVWEANNSRGFGGVDYYSRGKAIAIGLDIAIRNSSNGIHSLDDVIVALNRECKDGRVGFSESRIKELCVFFGGPALSEIYDQAVNRAGAIPLELMFANSGFTWNNGFLIENESATPLQKAIANSFPDPIR